MQLKKLICQTLPSMVANPRRVKDNLVCRVEDLDVVAALDELGGPGLLKEQGHAIAVAPTVRLLLGFLRVDDLCAQLPVVKIKMLHY